MSTLREAIATKERKRTGDAPFSIRRGKIPTITGTSLNDPSKKHRAAGGGENEDTDAELMEMISQVHFNMKLSVQLK